MDFKDLLKQPTFELKMVAGARLLLEGLSEVTGNTLDLDTDENFIKTPYRIAKAYLEMNQGLSQKQEIEDIFKTGFPSKYTGLIVEDRIDANSMCPHHFLPVKYKVDFGYIPNEKMLGLSKIPRFIQTLAAQPILQEDYTKQLIELFVEHVKPKGVIAVVSGVHNCMICRGVKVVDTAATTSAVYGAFDELDTRLEFFELLKIRSR